MFSLTQIYPTAIRNKLTATNVDVSAPSAVIGLHLFKHLLKDTRCKTGQSVRAQVNDRLT